MDKKYAGMVAANRREPDSINAYDNLPPKFPVVMIKMQPAPAVIMGAITASHNVTLRQASLTASLPPQVHSF